MVEEVVERIAESSSGSDNGTLSQKYEKTFACIIEDIQSLPTRDRLDLVLVLRGYLYLSHSLLGNTLQIVVDPDISIHLDEDHYRELIAIMAKISDTMFNNFLEAVRVVEGKYPGLVMESNPFPV